MLGPRLKYSSCLWPDGVAHARRGRGGDARADLRAGRGRGRHDAARPRLRLGLADRLARRALSRARRSSRSRTRGRSGEWIEALRLPERRRRSPPTSTRSSSSGASTGSSRSRCSSTCATTRRCWRASRPGSSRTAASSATSSRTTASRTPTRTAGWRGGSSRPGRCPRTTCCRSFQRDLVLDEHWRVSGHHYARTAEAWLRAAGREPRRGRAVLVERTAPGEAAGSWRVFFLACAGLWGYRGGREWLVSHYRFARRSAAGARRSAVQPSSSSSRRDRYENRLRRKAQCSGGSSSRPTAPPRSRYSTWSRTSVPVATSVSSCRCRQTR